MSKTFLRPVALVSGVVALMAVPAMAQATTIQAGGSALGTGAAYSMQSTNFLAETENEKAEKGPTLKCTHMELTGKVTENGGEVAAGSVSGSAFTGCTAGATTAHISTNATPFEPWGLRLQQPDAKGTIIGHLTPAPGKSIQFTQQPQLFGMSVTTCDYSTADLQITIQPNFEGHVAGVKQFVRQAGNPVFCYLYGSASAQIQLAATPGGSIQIDMT